MTDVLRDGTVTEEERTTLRKHRLQHGMDAVHHIGVLEKLGWTLNEYEEGKRA